MKIIIIGTGNVGTIIARLFRNAGHQILQVYGRNKSHAALLAQDLQCDNCTAWKDIRGDGDLYIAALSDKALGEMATLLRLPGKLVVHTAGSVPMDILQPVSEYHGVLYPLQSIRKEFPPEAVVPFLVDGSNQQAKDNLLKIASVISSLVRETNDEERAKLHVAAVIVNNFTNHLYAMAEDFCKKESLNFSLLVPLIQETANRMQRITPGNALTGPASRNDVVTIERHLLLLNEFPELQKMYQDFTQSIINFYR